MPTTTVFFAREGEGHAQVDGEESFAFAAGAGRNEYYLRGFAGVEKLEVGAQQSEHLGDARAAAFAHHYIFAVAAMRDSAEQGRLGSFFDIVVGLHLVVEQVEQHHQ
jgi:hypothetical protein